MENWQRESANMAYAYQNSLITLAATSSTGSHTGLLYDRVALKYPVIPTRLFWDPNRQCASGALPESQQSYWETSVLGGHLQTRGWTLQERAMAPRILHFTKDEIYWECAALIAAETAPYGLTVRRLRKEVHMGRAQPTIS